jgi:hypothetical protein
MGSPCQQHPIPQLVAIIASAFKLSINDISSHAHALAADQSRQQTPLAAILATRGVHSSHHYQLKLDALGEDLSRGFSAARLFDGAAVGPFHAASLARGLVILC